MNGQHAHRPRRDDVATDLDIVVVRGKILLDLGRARRWLGLEPDAAREIGLTMLRKAAACDAAAPPPESPGKEDRA